MFYSATQWAAAPRRLPAGTEVFAIGDVHGHFDELQQLHAVIDAESASWRGGVSHVVHLGDYVDRGPDTKSVLQHLCARGAARPNQRFLRGNHDQFLIELLELDPTLDREFITHWYNNGGTRTMESLGIEGYGRLLAGGNLLELQACAHASLGSDLVAFLLSLESMVVIGDYVFVHAGIDPARALEDQDIVDLLMIREPFLSAGRRWSHPFCVVHGHSIAMPAIQAHRIGADAGCYLNGALCAVQLRDDQARFLAVTKIQAFDWKVMLGGAGDQWRWQAAKPVRSGA